MELKSVVIINYNLAENKLFYICENLIFISDYLNCSSFLYISFNKFCCSTESTLSFYEPILWQQLVSNGHYNNFSSY